MATTRAKSPPQKNRAVAQAAVTTIDPDVLTLSEAAEYVRVSEADVLRMVTKEQLPGRLFGETWRFFKPAPQQWLGSSPFTGDLLSHFGTLRDDPHQADF
jgi:excisionase family DNA binding protein